MKFRLRLSGLDEEKEEKLFDSEQEAVEYARKWFLDGYDDNKTLDDEDRCRAREYADKIAPELLANASFCCPMFCETITLDRIDD